MSVPPVTKSVSDFLDNPDTLFNTASRVDDRGYDPEFSVLVKHRGEDVEVRVTSIKKAGVALQRDEKLKKYKNNPEARDRAIERAFRQAASGMPVRITTTPNWNGSRTAVLVRADMNG